MEDETVIERRTVIFGLLTGVVGTTFQRALAGPVTTDNIGDQVQTLPRGQLPEFGGPDTPGVRRLYQYAVDHGNDLQSIPCFCGCSRVGHKSNRDCYIKSFNRDGTLTFTSHAAT